MPPVTLFANLRYLHEIQLTTNSCQNYVKHCKVAERSPFLKRDCPIAGRDMKWQKVEQKGKQGNQSS